MQKDVPQEERERRKGEHRKVKDEVKQIIIETRKKTKMKI